MTYPIGTLSILTGSYDDRATRLIRAVPTVTCMASSTSRLPVGHAGKHRGSGRTTTSDHKRHPDLPSIARPPTLVGVGARRRPSSGSSLTLTAVCTG